MTECEDADEDRLNLRVKMDRVSRPSCVFNEMKLAEMMEVAGETESVLGCIHLDLAMYHEACRSRLLRIMFE